MVTSAFNPERRAGNGASRGRRGERVNEPLPSGQPPLGNKRLKGRYKLGPLLGHGSLGMTYRAEDTLLQRPVAIKMLADRYADDAVFRERFMAATAAAGRHAVRGRTDPSKTRSPRPPYKGTARRPTSSPAS